jgi:transposase-like protein
MKEKNKFHSINLIKEQSEKNHELSDEIIKDTPIVSDNKPIIKSSKKCIDCSDNILKSYNKRCNACNKINKIKESTINNKIKPTKEQLKKDLQELKFYSNVGKKYNVSDNTIRYWLKETNEITSIKNPSTTKKCLDCKIPIFYKSIRCTKCTNLNRIKENTKDKKRPSLEQLKSDLNELKSMVQVGIKYGVSDNAVRKWIKNYEKLIPQ